MKILALESSAVACSACLCEDDFLIAQSYENSGMTHSKTLLPMAEELMKHCGVKPTEIDVIAVAAGPGSFTGLRIGVSAAKGLAWALDKPCAKVSTLEAMAWNLSVLPGRLCPVMDARRSQVYNALFASDGETVTRLTPDRAIGLDELAGELKASGERQILVGDGAGLCYNEFTKRGLTVGMVPPNLRYQSAWGVARAALDQAREGKLISAADLVPDYHRLSQAERERLEREKEMRYDKMEHMDKVHVLDHPLLQHKLSILRDERTGVKEFREVVSEIATLMCYEATRDLPLADVEIKTPVATATFKQIAGKKLAIVPVLRAGLGMVDGILTLIPGAKVGHIGLYRDPDSLEPVEYYCKMPTDIAEREVIVLDPMLATGGSASAAIQFIKNYDVKHIKLMNILAAPQGIERVHKDHPDVDIYVAAVDEKLNDHGYIVPGLGDAGDRIFGTK